MMAGPGELLIVTGGLEKGEINLLLTGEWLQSKGWHASMSMGAGVKENWRSGRWKEE